MGSLQKNPLAVKLLDNRLFMNTLFAEWYIWASLVVRNGWSFRLTWPDNLGTRPIRSSKPALFWLISAQQTQIKHLELDCPIQQPSALVQSNHLLVHNDQAADSSRQAPDDWVQANFEWRHWAVRSSYDALWMPRWGIWFKVIVEMGIHFFRCYISNIIWKCR